MKQTIINRLMSCLQARRAFVAMICMLLLISAPLPSMAQRRGSGERTERRDNNKSERRNNDRHENRKNDNRGGRRPSFDQNNNRRPNKDKDININRPNNGGNNHRPNGGGNNARPGNNNHRPNGGGNFDRPGNNNNHRPNGGGNFDRPGNNNNHRPNGGPNVRPGNNNNHRPNGGPNVRPGNNHRPGAGMRPTGPAHNWNPGRPNHVRPGHSIHRPPVAPPPHRPHRPAHFFGYHRPLPPPAWRPGPRPLFSTVLGLTFGTAINIGIDALISNGYIVDGYADDCIYVNDVVQLNMRWPYGVLQYNNGLLAGSEFTYSSDWRDLNRYNMAYARLSSLYGPPVSSYSNRGDLSATWWGPGGQYVTLRFDYRAPLSGRNRYYTTLSFGL